MDYLRSGCAINDNTDDVILQYCWQYPKRNRPQSRKPLASYGNAEIAALADHFDDILSEDEHDGIIEVDTTQKMSPCKDQFNASSGKNVLDIHTDLLRISPPNLSNIIIMIKLLLTISVSTATVEHSFSTLKRIKTSQRSTIK